MLFLFAGENTSLPTAGCKEAGDRRAFCQDKEVYQRTGREMWREGLFFARIRKFTNWQVGRCGESARIRRFTNEQVSRCKERALSARIRISTK
jgi:hypothetical protein